MNLDEVCGNCEYCASDGFLNLADANSRARSSLPLTAIAPTTKEVERLGRRLNRLWDAKERRRGTLLSQERISARKRVELTAAQEFDI